MKNTDTQNMQVVPVSFTDALLAQGKTSAKTIFSCAYEWGNQKAIPENALRNVWPESSIVDDKLETYLDTVYFVQYCALQYWEKAANHEEAEEWRTKCMDAWGRILDMIGCEFKRFHTDFIYIVSRATIDGKADKESINKVIKPMSKTAFRKRIEMLAGMALKGFVFVNPLESLENIVTTRTAKAEKAAEKAVKQAAKDEAQAKKADEKKQPAQEKKNKKAQKAKQNKAKPAAKQNTNNAKQEAKTDELPTLDALVASLDLPSIGTSSITGADAA